MDQDTKKRTVKRRVIIAGTAVLAVVCIILLVVFLISRMKPPVTIVANALGDHVSIHTEVQEQYLNAPMQDVAEYTDGTEELSRPAPITLTWSTKLDESYARDHGISADACEYTVTFSKSADLSDAVLYSTDETSYQVTNLELDTAYYWKVSTEIDGKEYESETTSFTTERSGPRVLYVDGITNVRDIGGYTTMSGDTVRQGRLIRCGKLHRSDGSLKITDEGIAEMRKNLGVKSEIDLRQASDNENGGLENSVLGEDVNYYPLPMEYEGNMIEGTFSEDNVGSLRGVFEVLSKEENYPVIFHCAIGTDRTGMVAYCIEALLGMSETDIVRDYLFSNFSEIDTSRSIATIRSKYPKFIKNYDGKTLQEKTYKFLNEYVGVPTEQLDAVIKLNLVPRDDAPVGTPIASEEEFLKMKADGKYYLSEDITLSSSYQSQFFGVLDGNGHTVTTERPIFDELCGVVKNLNIKGSVTASDDVVGALARKGTRSICINVKNHADVTMTDKNYAAGLVGYTAPAAIFIGCENYGDVSSAYHAAGIVCRTEGELTLSDCKNEGAVTVTSPSENRCAGGIVAKSEGSLMMQGCENSGAVLASSEYIGGLGGYLDAEDVMKTVLSCENSGSVACGGESETANSYIGGLVGFMEGGRSYCAFSHCRNVGEVISYAGGTVTLCGICGYVDSDSIIVAYCANEGKMSASQAEKLVKQELIYDPTDAEEKYIHDNE